MKFLYSFEVAIFLVFSLKIRGKLLEDMGLWDPCLPTVPFLLKKLLSTVTSACDCWKTWVAETHVFQQFQVLLDSGEDFFGYKCNGKRNKSFFLTYCKRSSARMPTRPLWPQPKPMIAQAICSGWIWNGAVVPEFWFQESQWSVCKPSFGIQSPATRPMALIGRLSLRCQGPLPSSRVTSSVSALRNQNMLFSSLWRMPSSEESQMTCYCNLVASLRLSHI